MSRTTESFEFVYVPADLSEPLEGWVQEYRKENEVECLFDRIKVGGAVY